jgi:hypothetical protein
MLLKVGSGAKNGSQMAIIFLLWGLLPSTRQFGKLKTEHVFDGKLLNNPIEIICHAYVLSRLWIGLQNDGDKEMLINGVNAMLKIAKAACQTI